MVISLSWSNAKYSNVSSSRISKLSKIIGQTVMGSMQNIYVLKLKRISSGTGIIYKQSNIHGLENSTVLIV